MDLLFGIALSAHLGLNDTYNEIHPHIRLETDSLSFGAYYNSVEELSLYSIKRFEYNDFGFEFGLATGYDAIGPIIPTGRITYNINEKVQYFVAPAAEKIDNETTLGIVMGTELRF